MDRNWQERAVEFAEMYDLRHTPQTHTLDLVSEVGEVAKELLLGSGYGKRPFIPPSTLPDELGDVLYSLCLLATAVNVNLDEALTSTLAKYQARLNAKNHTSSQ